MNLVTGQQWWHRQREQTSGPAGEGEGGTNSKSSTETYTLPCVKQIASGKLLYNTRELNQVLYNNLEGKDGVGGGSPGRKHMLTYGWLMLLYSRNQYNIVKQLSSNLK